MITNLSTASVKCSHYTLFSETNTRVAKKTGPSTVGQSHLTANTLRTHDRIEWEYCRYFLATHSTTCWPTKWRLHCDHRYV